MANKAIEHLGTNFKEKKVSRPVRYPVMLMPVRFPFLPTHLFTATKSCDS